MYVQVLWAAEVEGGEARIKDYGQYSLQEFYGNYGYPQQHCVTFSNMDMDATGDCFLQLLLLLMMIIIIIIILRGYL